MGKIYEIGTKYNDVLTEDIIKEWDFNNVILNGATGSGKTYFVENNLHKYAQENFKNILFLCNRKALYDDVREEKETYSLHSLNVMLYQTLESKLIKGEEIGEYDYIVCDEFHYVLTDSLFNIYTDLTYYWIINQSASTKIFMSGTGTNIFNKLKEEGIVNDLYEYTIPYDYSYADLKIFKEKEDVFDIINNVINNTDDKIVYFANSLDTAIEVYRQFKDYAHLRCSKKTGNEYADNHNDVECIKVINRDLITFSNRLLITTKVLDNGINIKDRALKHIICDIFDLDSHQQCLGRKRIIDKDDTCTFYIRNYSKKSIAQFKGGISKNFNPVKLFVDDIEKFQDKYNKNRKFHSNYIYFEGESRQYNRLAYWKMQNTLKEIAREMKSSFAGEIFNRLNTINSLDKLEELEKFIMKDEIELYLDDVKGKRLYKKEQNELINELKITDKRGRIQSSIKQLNAYLQKNYKKYIFTDKDKRRVLENGEKNPNRDCCFWEIRDGMIE